MSKFTEFSNNLAAKITATVGSMGCAYIFTLVALISLPAAIASHSVIVIVSWVAQTFLQLVLLSIIMVGQNLQSQQSEEHTARTLKHISKDNDRNKNPRGRDHGVFSYYGMPITTSLVAGLSDWSLGS